MHRSRGYAWNRYSLEVLSDLGTAGGACLAPSQSLGEATEDPRADSDRVALGNRLLGLRNRENPFGAAPFAPIPKRAWTLLKTFLWLLLLREAGDNPSEHGSLYTYRF